MFHHRTDKCDKCKSNVHGCTYIGVSVAKHGRLQKERWCFLLHESVSCITGKLLLPTPLGPEVVRLALPALLGLEGVGCTAVAAHRLVQQIVLSQSALLDVSYGHVKVLTKCLTD